MSNTTLTQFQEDFLTRVADSLPHNTHLLYRDPQSFVLHFGPTEELLPNRPTPPNFQLITRAEKDELEDLTHLGFVTSADALAYLGAAGRENLRYFAITEQGRWRVRLLELEGQKAVPA